MPQEYFFLLRSVVGQFIVNSVDCVWAPVLFFSDGGIVDSTA